MRTVYFLIWTCLLVNILACQGVSQDKSQTNQKDVAAKSIPLKLKLNNEELGTTDNTSILSKKLEEVFKNRENEGTIRKGTNEVEKETYLGADRSVSAEEIAKLFGVLNRLGTSPILIPVQTNQQNSRMNPLLLYVYAGSGKRAEPIVAGIEIGFTGALFENGSIVSPDNGGVMVAADKNGTYTMEGKQFSAGDLKIEIKKRLKTTVKNKRIIFVQAQNYGNIEDVASIAASAGAIKINAVTKNIEQKENGMSFSLSPAFVKDKNEQISGFQSVRFNGSDSSSFEITTSDELLDKERAESEIKQDYENRKSSFGEAAVSMTKIDGSSGVLTIQNETADYHAYWFGFRTKNGKQQMVTIMFSCRREESNYSRFELFQVLKSIKFN